MAGSPNDIEKQSTYFWSCSATEIYNSNIMGKVCYGHADLCKQVAQPALPNAPNTRSRECQRYTKSKTGR